MTETNEPEKKRRHPAENLAFGAAILSAVAAAAVVFVPPLRFSVVDHIKDAAFLTNLSGNKDPIQYSLTGIHGSFKLNKMKPSLASRYDVTEVKCIRESRQEYPVSKISMTYSKAGDYNQTYFTIIAAPQVDHTKAYQKVTVDSASEIIDYSSAIQTDHAVAGTPAAGHEFDFESMMVTKGQIGSNTSGFDNNILPAFQTAQQLCSSMTPYQTARSLGATLTASPTPLNESIAMNSEFLEAWKDLGRAATHLMYNPQTRLVYGPNAPEQPRP